MSNDRFESSQAVLLETGGGFSAAVKTYLDYHVTSLAALREKAEPLLRELREQGERDTVKMSEIERRASSELEDCTVMSRAMIASIGELSDEVNCVVERIRSRVMQVSDTMVQLDRLSSKATFIQNASNYLHLVAKCTKIVNLIDRNLEKSEELNRYSDIIKRSEEGEEERAREEDYQKNLGLFARQRSSESESSEWDDLVELCASSLVDPFFELLEYHVFLLSMNCYNLKKMLRVQIGRLAQKLELKLKAVYQATIEAIGWPTSLAESQLANKTTLNCFKLAFSLLARFQQGLEASFSASSSRLQLRQEGLERGGGDPETLFDSQERVGKGVSGRLWCLDALFEPLYLRFRYNFCTPNKKTNRFDEPKWHFAYVRSLMESHEKFFEFVNSILDLLRIGAYDVKVEFLRGIMVYVNRKIEADIRAINAAYDVGRGSREQTSQHWQSRGFDNKAATALSTSFAQAGTGVGERQQLEHEAMIFQLINETLDFEEVLTDHWGYPPIGSANCLHPIQVIASIRTPSTWPQIEARHLREHLREALDCQNAWERQFSSVDKEIDVDCVPRHTYTFFNLLSSSHNRFRLLSPGYESMIWAFVRSEADLLCDYFEELRDLEPAETDRASMVQCAKRYNAANYCLKTLRAWGESAFYARLQMWIQGVASVDQTSGTAWDGPIAECERLAKEMMAEMVQATLRRVASAFGESYMSQGFLKSVLPDYWKTGLTLSLGGIFGEETRELDLGDAATESSVETARASGEKIDVSFQMTETVAVLQEWFGWIFEHLCMDGIRGYCKKLAKAMNSWMLENVVLNKKFTRPLAMQLRYDIKALLDFWTSSVRRCLAASEEGDSFVGSFAEIEEAVILLALDSTEYRRVYYLLKSESPRIDSSLNFEHLSRKKAIDILKRRVEK